MIPVLIALVLSTLAALAEATDGTVVAALPIGDKIYTNATFTRVTPAYAVVNSQQGVIQIPLSNLPAAYQTQFGYTPEKAAHFLDEEKQIQQKQRAAVLAQQAALQALAGTNRLLRITSVSDDPSFHSIPLCSTDGINGGILVENLPDSVKQFLSAYGQLQVDVAGCEQQLNNLKPPPTNAAPQPSMGKSLLVENGANFVNISAPPTDNTAAIRQNLEDRLNALNVQLAQATTNYNIYTTIIAYPSGQSYGGKPIWVYTGRPPVVR